MRQIIVRKTFFTALLLNFCVITLFGSAVPSVAAEDLIVRFYIGIVTIKDSEDNGLRIREFASQRTLNNETGIYTIENTIEGEATQKTDYTWDSEKKNYRAKNGLLIFNTPDGRISTVKSTTLPPQTFTFKLSLQGNKSFLGKESIDVNTISGEGIIKDESKAANPLKVNYYLTQRLSPRAHPVRVKQLLDKRVDSPMEIQPSLIEGTLAKHHRIATACLFPQNVGAKGPMLFDGIFIQYFPFLKIAFASRTDKRASFDLPLVQQNETKIFRSASSGQFTSAILDLGIDESHKPVPRITSWKSIFKGQTEADSFSEILDIKLGKCSRKISRGSAKSDAVTENGLEVPNEAFFSAKARNTGQFASEKLLKEKGKIPGSRLLSCNGNQAEVNSADGAITTVYAVHKLLFVPKEKKIIFSSTDSSGKIATRVFSQLNNSGVFINLVDTSAAIRTIDFRTPQFNWNTKAIKFYFSGDNAFNLKLNNGVFQYDGKKCSLSFDLYNDGEVRKMTTLNSLDLSDHDFGTVTQLYLESIFKPVASAKRNP